MNYVSCSPYRVPIARLAATQSALDASAEKKAAREETCTKKSSEEKKIGSSQIIKDESRQWA